MKNSKEIASAVFQARDEYIKQRKQLIRRIKLATAIGGTVCALCLTIAGVGYWNSLQQKLPAINSDTGIITDISEKDDFGGDNDALTPMATAPVTTGSEGENKPVVTTAVQSDVQTEPAVTQIPVVTQTSAVTQTAVTTKTTAVSETSAVTQTSPAIEIGPSKQTTTTVTFSPGETITTTTTEAESVKILDINELKSRYDDSLVVTESTAIIIWPWEYKPIYRQYNTFTLNDIQYNTSGNKIRKFLLEEKVGTVSVMGYDDDKAIQTMECEVYSLRNVTQERYVAVKFGDTYYVCANRVDNPTSTLGELLDQVNLPKLVELEKFQDNDKYPYNHYSLLNDDYIWEVLSECRDAPYIDDNSWSYLHKGGVGFSITSESLGAYKLAMYITKDGYIWTNMLSHYRYVFYIGEEASAKIIEYAMENSEEAESEPYMNSIAGTIVEITDDYMVIDDSILCENPEEGIQFTILLNDILISRYVDYGVVDVGDFVKITFKGEIYSDYVIDSAISADIAYIDGDGYYVLE